MQFKLLHFGGLVAAALTMEYTSHLKVGQEVITTSGRVRGKAASVEKEVSVYLGIPYAQPPVGDLRFAPPQKFIGSGRIDGTNFGPSCPITTVFGGGAPPNITGKNFTAVGLAILESLSQPWDRFSEDCLKINVWTKPQAAEKDKAVMVWIHGGGYSLGSSSDPTFDGQHIVAEEDVVFVSFNYRMNIFGFPGNPHSPANLALMDQRLAVEWVRDKIHAFGGDPSRIILFGQSAGGGSIDLYSYAYTSDPIISGMILQSGTTSLGAYTQGTAAESWYNVTSTLDCGHNTTDLMPLMACMRNKTTSDIISAMPQSNAATGSAYFWPTIDDVLVFSDYSSRSTTGKFIKVPMLIGNTDYESGYLRAMSSAFDAYLPDEHWDAFNLQVYTCPSAERANLSTSFGLPTWRYRYFGDFEELALTTSTRSGAYHASELAPLFGTVNAFGEIRPSSELIEVGRYLRGAWAAFAKDPERGLERYGWPRYRLGGRTLIGLSYNNSAGTAMLDEKQYDSCDQVESSRRSGCGSCHV